MYNIWNIASFEWRRVNGAIYSNCYLAINIENLEKSSVGLVSKLAWCNDVYILTNLNLYWTQISSLAVALEFLMIWIMLTCSVDFKF